jgi:D-glycero-D-manno-heptose 1,7-bisphosphate phosphatase
MKRPAVFLDRDGTLIEEVNYLSRVEDLRIFPYSAEAIRILKDRGFLVIVITNQSGIGRGVYDEAAMHSIHYKIQEDLDGAIDAFYFCPHTPEDACNCRKPNMGMIEAACNDHSIDLMNSWMIGDKSIDVEVGKRAGLASILVLTGYGNEHQNSLKVQPDEIVNDLLEAAYHIRSAGSGNFQL